MQLIEIKIENFRGIRSLTLPLDRLTVIIGENNTGKSTILEAIKFVLSRGFGARRSAFSDYDFHLKDINSTPQNAEPITIILHFAENYVDEWPDSLIQQLGEICQLDPEGLHHIWFKVNGIFQHNTAGFETSWCFLNQTGDELRLKNATPLNLISKFAPLFFLSALRDASQEFGQRGPFWSGFLKSIQLPDEQREQVEGMLREINASVINSNIGLTEVAKTIADAGQFVPLNVDDPVSLEAIPTRVFDMVGKIQVFLKSSHGTKLPLHRHGEGTQSLAVLMLFQAFVAVNLAEVYAPESRPILALEEPEAHLHPSAIRSLGSFLENISGQVLIASHSGDLVSRVPIMALRRLYKHDGDTKFGQVESETFTEQELQSIDCNIRLTKGHYLFSRCWLLVEGVSEFHMMPAIFEIMGYPQDHINFSVLEVSQVVNKGEPFIKLANSLGIQWFLMADNDSGGDSCIRHVSNHLLPGENLSDRALQLQLDIEHEFWHNEYHEYITGLISNRRKRQIESESTNETEKIQLIIKSAIKKVGGKPAFAQILVREARQRGKDSIPRTIQDIINRIVYLAGGLT